MNRRAFTRQLAATIGAGAAIHAGAGAQDPARPAQTHDDAMARMLESIAPTPAEREAVMPTKRRHIAMVIYPGMFPLDLVGPHAVLSGLLNTTVHIVAKDRAPVAANGLTFVPTTTLAECPSGLDVLFVPGGGPGTIAMMRDPALLEFLRREGPKARFVTSVCTGSLVLGAAGLLKGYRATTHWVTHDILSLVGATPVQARVVEDRNRITAAGVSAGIDFGLALAARMTNADYARSLQLNIEYDPAPPFRAGSPAGAGDRITGIMRTMYQPLVAAARAAATAAG